MVAQEPSPERGQKELPRHLYVDALVISLGRCRYRHRDASIDIEMPQFAVDLAFGFLAMPLWCLHLSRALVLCV
jgi:hypothetical protein